MTVGALKSGKSTLINALVGHRVSPDGTGAETTKKCSVIMSEEEGHPAGITLYRCPGFTTHAKERKEVEESGEKLTGLLMEYFKGIREWDAELKKLFETRYYSLHQKNLDPAGRMDNLEYVLTSEDFSALQQFRDFFIAEIRIKVDPQKNCILNHHNHKIAIVDMPGLDGTMAGVEARSVSSAFNPVNYLPKFCHLFLLVQSSISGLNRTTADTIMAWRSEKRSTPVYLVFNTIESKSGWYTEDAMLGVKNVCEKRAQKELENRGVRYKSFFSINAAKGWEALQAQEYGRCWKEGKKGPGLWEESKVQELEDALCKDFDEQLERIIQEDALDGISASLRQYQEELETMEDSIKMRRQDIIREQQDWDKVVKCVREVSRSVRRDEIEELAAKYWDSKMMEAGSKIHNAIMEGMAYPLTEKDKTQCKDFCGEMELLAEKVRKTISRCHVENGFVTEMNSLLERKYLEFYSVLETQIGKLEVSGNEVNIKEVKEEIKRFGIWKDATQELQEQFPHEDPDGYLDKKNYKGILRGPWTEGGRKERREDFANRYEDGYKKLLKTEIKEKLVGYCVVAQETGDCLLNRRINMVMEHLQQVWESKGRALEEELHRLDVILHHIPEMQKHMEQITASCRS